jgi:transposase
MDLTDEQWAVLEPLIGAMPRRADAGGRPVAQQSRGAQRHLMDLTDWSTVG